MTKPKAGDTGNSPPQDLTVEQRFAALLEIEDTPPDPQTPPDAEPKKEEIEDDDDDLDVDVDDDTSGEEEPADDTTDDDDDETDEDVYEFTVTIDGKQEKVDSDELVKGYQRQQDYSRKTARLADEKKEFETERQGVQQERAQYADLLGRLEKIIEDSMEKEPDWDTLRRDNPSEYAALRADWTAQQQKLTRVQEEKARVAKKAEEDAIRQLQTHVEGERQKMVAAIPEWQDPAKLKEGQQALTTYASQVGFSPEELAQVVDHRAIVILRKAMLYDQLQGQKPQIRKKAKGAPTLKPGARKRPKAKGDKVQRAKEQLKQTGSIDAATGAFLAMLEAESK